MAGLKTHGKGFICIIHKNPLYYIQAIVKFEIAEEILTMDSLPYFVILQSPIYDIRSRKCPGRGDGTG